jgi:hypothetical protein
MPGYCLPGLTAATTYILLPATDNILCPKNQQRLLPIQAAVTNCSLEAPGRSSWREKNTLTPHL